MKKRFTFSKAVASLLCCLLLLLPLFVVSVSGSVVNDLPVVSGASTVYLYNFESDQILLKRSSIQQIAPASTVKIMTGLLAIRHLENRLEESVIITSDMLEGVEGYTLKLKEGMTIKILDLLYGVICGGGNDAANILAVLCCGSVDSFVEEMNAQAIAWGCQNTRYTNPTGIDSSEMTTTLDDTVIIAKKAIEDPLFLEISSASNHTYKPEGATDSTVFYNRNAQISSFSGIGYQNKYVKGLNAGMTDRGGYCVVSYATDGNASYLCIVMGATATADGIMSYRIANNLINHVIWNYSYMEIAKKGTEICTVPVRLALPQSGNTEALVSCVLAEDLYGYLPAEIDPSKNLNYRYYLHHDTLTAPVTAGTVVGGVDIYLGSTAVAHAKLIVTEELPSASLLKGLDAMKQIILSRQTILSVIAFAVLLTFYLYCSVIRRKKKKPNMLRYETKRKQPRR